MHIPFRPRGGIFFNRVPSLQDRGQVERKVRRGILQGGEMKLYLCAA